MEFNKDTLKKVIKYVLMMVVVTFAALSVPKQLISMNDLRFNWNGSSICICCP